MRTYEASRSVIRRLEWNLKSAAYLGRHPDEAGLIRPNGSLRRTHRGRCFIVGNGPSITDDDLSLLRDEAVITVNNFRAPELATGTGARYHVVSDRRFLSLDVDSEEDAAVLAALREIFATDGLQCFVPSSEVGFISRARLDVGGNVSYFCNPHYFTDFYVMTNDFTRCIPRFSSVVHHAILLATFLGFDKIYLLGCDATNIVANINTALGQPVGGDYGYEVSADLDGWFTRQLAKRTMERCAESYLEVLVGYRWLERYCRDSGTSLVNCSSRTVIDSIPRLPLERVLAGR
jgi:hypothetical protein